MSLATRVLAEDELKLIDGLRVAAEKRPVTLKELTSVVSGNMKASDFTTPLKLADNLWIALTLEERSHGGPVWHLSVSLRGRVPPDDLVLSIAGRLGLQRFVFEEDVRFGPLVRHVIAPRSV